MKFDNTIHLSDVLFIICFLVVGFLVMKYDIARCNECIEKMNECTKFYRPNFTNTTIPVNISGIVGK
jgi:hypothetical protein